MLVADGSVVANLLCGVEANVLLSEGRVTTWTEEGFTGHDPGERLHEVAAEGIRDLAHVDEATVIDLGGCGAQGAARGFEVLFLAVEDPEGDPVPVTLTGSQGTEVWRDRLEVDLCGVGQGVVDDRLFLSTGSVVAPDCPVAHPEPADVDPRLGFVPNGVQSDMGATRTFHPTPV